MVCAHVTWTEKVKKNHVEYRRSKDTLTEGYISIPVNNNHVEYIHTTFGRNKPHLNKSKWGAVLVEFRMPDPTTSSHKLDGTSAQCFCDHVGTNNVYQKQAMQCVDISILPSDGKLYLQNSKAHKTNLTHVHSYITLQIRCTSCASIFLTFTGNSSTIWTAELHFWVAIPHVPIESLCVRLPLTMYVTISMFACECVPNPRFGCTKSSFITCV